MAVGYNALLQITAKTKGLEAVASLQQGIDLLSDSAEKAGERMNRASEQSKNFGGDTARTAAITAGIVMATKAAIDFETSMSQVRKVVDGLETPQAFSQIQQEILDLSREIPIAIDGIADIYAAAGQGGVARRDLKEFAVLVGEVAVAFDMTAKDAGVSLSQLQSSLGMTAPQVRLLADAINYLDNNTGAAASGLVEFMTRSGSVGQIAGLSAEKTAAFGAAMLTFGTDTEVAATTFNSLIKALAKGPSMTDRQVEALRRLGYQMQDAQEIERDLTRQAESDSQQRVRTAEREAEIVTSTARRASEDRIKNAEREADETIREAQRQSDEKIRIAREEEDALNKSISRRFRDERRDIRRAEDDQNREIERGYRSAEREQLKSLKRQEEAEVRAAEERARLGGYSAREEVEAIRDRHDSIAEEIKDETQKRLTSERRAAEDRMTIIEDELEDKEDAEKAASEERLRILKEEEDAKIEQLRESAAQKLDVIRDEEEQKLAAITEGAKERLQALKDAEAAVLDEARRIAKETGESLAAASAQAFADRLQKDAEGTILEVLQKISDLPKAQQTSIISDLFGDEARGLPNLVNNLDKLKEILKLVGDEGEYAGSVSAEAAIRFGTAASEVQKFWNNLEGLNIAIGNVFTPLLGQVLQLINPLIYGLTALVNIMSGFLTNMARSTLIIGGLSVSLGALIGPIIAATTAFGAFLSLATLSRWASAIPILAAVPGPLRMIAIALGAIGLSATPLGPIISTLGTILFLFQGIKLVLGAAGLVAPFVGALTGLVTWMASVFVPAMIAFFSGPVGWITLAVIAVGAMAFAFREPIMGFLGWLGEQLALVPGFFMGLGDQLKTWLGGLIESMRLAIDPFIQGFLQGTNDLLVAIQTAWNSAPQFFSDIWSKITQAVTTRINELRALGKGLADFFVSIPGRIATAFRTGFQAAVNSIKGVINAVLRGAGNAINSFIQSVNNMIASINRISARVGISLSYIPTVAIPQFATGAFVTGPTIGRVGEDEDEYIIPANQMERATQNFQRGRRGAAVLNSNPGPSRGGPVNVSVNFSGQVIDLGNGRRAVTMEDVVGLLEANNAAIMDAMGEAPMQLAVRGF